VSAKRLRAREEALGSAPFRSAPATSAQAPPQTLQPSRRSATVSATPGRLQRQRSTTAKSRSGDGVAFVSMDTLTDSAREHLAKLSGDGDDEAKAAAAGRCAPWPRKGLARPRRSSRRGPWSRCVGALKSPIEATVENCVTAVLDVALDEKAKAEILKIGDFVANIVHVLECDSITSEWPGIVPF